MSWLVALRPVRAEMSFEPTEAESQIVSEHYAYLEQLRASGIMTAEIRPYRISVR